MTDPCTGHLVPLELQESIIDHLQHDKKFLALASLVCRDWRLRSYKHVFSSITITNLSVLVYALFLQNSFSASAIFFQVRRVRLGPANCTHPWTRQHLNALREVLSCLKSWGNITHFALSRVRWTTIGFDIMSFIYNNFKMVSTIHLSGMWFSMPAEFIDLIAAFPRLKYVTFQDIECLWVPDSPTAINPSPTSTSYNTSSSLLPPGSYSCSFRVQENHTLRKDVRWTRHTSHLYAPLNRIELTRLAAHASVHNIDISSFIHSLGPSLHHLEITSPFQTLLVFGDKILKFFVLFFALRVKDLWSENPAHSLDLSRTTGLRQFSAGSPARVLTLLPWIVTILSQLPPTSRPTLRVLQIAFASSQQFFLDAPFLRSLASVLSHSQFENLQVIHFVAFSDCNENRLNVRMEQSIKQHMGYWHQKGALRFTFP
ncbi:hypothetical protein BDQ17DRAFT_1413386 [Cyathus striatus]|nr:hypothetical protein BDQ17DRAFT_1413386 [Cyathus striatus]